MQTWLFYNVLAYIHIAAGKLSLNIAISKLYLTETSLLSQLE